MDRMVQAAPYPTALAELVGELAYRPGWLVSLTDDLDRGQGSAGLTLIITTCGYDSYHPERGENYRVNHYFPVPPAAFDRRSWLWWLFQQFLLVEQHECMEFFRLVHQGEGGYVLADGSHADRIEERPYAPMHGPGNDPYLITVERTAVDRRTRFTGELAPE